MEHKKVLKQTLYGFVEKKLNFRKMKCTRILIL